MGAAQIQLMGNVATKPKQSMDNPGHERVSFRVIANDRRFDTATNTWVDGDEFSVTVICWGSLARGVAQSVLLGDPVVVNGKILNRRYEVEGETRYATEVKATTVSHDLSRGNATFRKVYHKPAETEAQARVEEPDSYEVRESLEQTHGIEDPFAVHDGRDDDESHHDEAHHDEAHDENGESTLRPAEFAVSANGVAPF